MTILCMGMSGSGKSVLLKCLQDPMNMTVADAASRDRLMTSLPTVGTNLVTLTKPRQKKNSNLPQESVTIREMGGSMAPLWHSYIEPSRTKALLYVIDWSSPETLGAATIYLLELLSHKHLEKTKVRIVFSKTDLSSVRTLSEVKAIMRLDQVMSECKQSIDYITFNAFDDSKRHEMYKWCMQFCANLDNT